VPWRELPPSGHWQGVPAEQAGRCQRGSFAATQVEFTCRRHSFRLPVVQASDSLQFEGGLRKPCSPQAVWVVAAIYSGRGVLCRPEHADDDATVCVCVHQATSGAVGEVGKRWKRASQGSTGHATSVCRGKRASMIWATEGHTSHTGVDPCITGAASPAEARKLVRGFLQLLLHLLAHVEDGAVARGAQHVLVQ